MSTQRPGFVRADTDRDIDLDERHDSTGFNDTKKKEKEAYFQETETYGEDRHAPPQYYDDEIEEGDKTQVVHNGQGHPNHHH